MIGLIFGETDFPKQILKKVRVKKKYLINVHDKARGVGGRSSFKRYKGKIGFDHGLQYLSPRSKEFKSFTNKLIKKKVNNLFLIF